MLLLLLLLLLLHLLKVVARTSPSDADAVGR
jgi:hypothetical protein